MSKVHRVLFDKEWREKLLNGTKTATIRKASSRMTRRVSAGDIIVAIHTIHTPVDKGFARFLVLVAEEMTWAPKRNKSGYPWPVIKDQHLARTGANRQWYIDRYGEAILDEPMKYIQFVRLEGGEG